MEETIAAIATPAGEGGIGIIRISGQLSKSIIDKIFTNKIVVSHKLYYGKIIDNYSSELIDEVMAVYMKSPKSYTTEDVVEIQCHGSFVSLRRILDLVLRNGARLAEPGEFTKRAFLNGRLDLSQAEAVIDLIKAKSEIAFDVALNQLNGKFSDKIKILRNKLTDSLVNIAVNIDYPDEDIEELTFDNLYSDLNYVCEEISHILLSYESGRIIREGLNVSIIGKPNVGKSSLMNALLKETRAIVTSIPGTTRDTIEEMILIRNIPIRLTDTAGIRQTDDVIEKIGIEKSKESFNKADLIIFMIDASRPLEKEDLDIAKHVGDRKAVVLVNKTDLPHNTNISKLKMILPNAKFIETSLIGGYESVCEVEEYIENMVFKGNLRQRDSMTITNVRHKALLDESKTSICDAIDSVKNKQPLELIEIDVKHAHECLGAIIGEEVEEDIINEVFSRFCLGK